MEFEPTFSPEKKLSLEKNEERAIEELRREGEKSKELKELIDKKWQEHEKDLREEEEELSPEKDEDEIDEEKEDIYNRYLEDLELSEEDLKGKSILDLGCGEVASFVQEALEKDFNVDIKGIDIDLDKNNIPEELKGVVEQGNFEESIPGENYDYIVAYGSIFAYEGTDPKKAILNGLNKLNSGGEMKIFPLNEPMEGELAGLEKRWKRIKSIIEEVAKEKNLDFEIKGKRIRVSGNDKHNKDIWIRNLATLKK